MSSGTVVEQPEFATKFRKITDDSGSDHYGRNLRGYVKAGKNSSIYVGGAGDLSIYPIGRSTQAGNAITLKGVQAGSFLPMFVGRVVWDSVSYLLEGDSLTFSGSPASTATDSTINVSSGLTTSGSGDIAGMTLSITVASNVVTAVTVKAIKVVQAGETTEVDKASADGFTTSDTITIPANWDKQGGSSFSVTTSTLNTLPATTATDLVAYY